MSKLITFETINNKFNTMNKFLNKELFESRLKIDSRKRMFFKPASMINNYLKSNSEEMQKRNSSINQKNISTSIVFMNQKNPIKQSMIKGKTKKKSKKQPASFNTVNNDLSSQKNRQTNFNKYNKYNKYNKCTNIVNNIKINHKKPALITININLTAINRPINKLNRTEDSSMQNENSCLFNKKRTNSNKNSKLHKNFDKKSEFSSKLIKMKSDYLSKGNNNKKIQNNLEFNNIKKLFNPNKKNNRKKNFEFKFIKEKPVQSRILIYDNKSNHILENDKPKKKKSKNKNSHINKSKNIFVFNIKPNSRNICKNKKSQFNKNKQFSLQNNSFENYALKKKLLQMGCSKRQFSKKYNSKDDKKNITEGYLINSLEENKFIKEKSDAGSENDEGMLSLDEVEDIMTYYKLGNVVEEKYLFFSNDYKNFMEKNKNNLLNFFVSH